MEPLWDSVQLSEMLRVPLATLKIWRHRRQIPFVKLNAKLVRYRPADIQAWLSDGAKKAAERGKRGE